MIGLYLSDFPRDSTYHSNFSTSRLVFLVDRLKSCKIGTSLERHKETIAKSKNSQLAKLKSESRLQRVAILGDRVIQSQWESVSKRVRYSRGNPK